MRDRVYKGESLNDRLDNAAAAKRAMVEKMKANAADLKERQAERKKALEVVSAQQREAAAVEKAKRQAAEEAAKLVREEQKRAEEEVKAKAAAELEALKAAQKKARDERYAKRKARQK